MPGVRVLKHLAIHPDIYQLKSIQNGSYICAGDSIFVKGNLNEIPGFITIFHHQEDIIILSGLEEH